MRYKLQMRHEHDPNGAPSLLTPMARATQAHAQQCATRTGGYLLRGTALMCKPCARLIALARLQAWNEAASPNRLRTIPQGCLPPLRHIEHLADVPIPK